MAYKLEILRYFLCISIYYASALSLHNYRVYWLYDMQDNLTNFAGFCLLLQDNTACAANARRRELPLACSLLGQWFCTSNPLASILWLALILAHYNSVTVKRVLSICACHMNNFRDNFERFQDSRMRGQFPGLSRKFRDGWQVCVFGILRDFFCISIYYASMLSLHIESTNSYDNIIWQRVIQKRTVVFTCLWSVPPLLW